MFQGWPVAGPGLVNDGQPLVADAELWPVHCYAMVGVARDLSPHPGSGAGFYTVIAHAPRPRDRHLQLIGRVIARMEPFSSLPRALPPRAFSEHPPQPGSLLHVRLSS